jgi:hypothetical protein
VTGPQFRRAPPPELDCTPYPEELARVAADAEATISTIRCSLTTGDELHRALVAAVGYGSGDGRLRAFCRSLQKFIERAR